MAQLDVAVNQTKVNEYIVTFRRRKGSFLGKNVGVVVAVS